MYLIEDAIAATVRRVASLVPSSTLVMSFLLPIELADREVRPGIARAAEGDKRHILPQLFHVRQRYSRSPMKLVFENVQAVSAAALAEPYFADRTDGLRPPNNSEELLVATTWVAGVRPSDCLVESNNSRGMTFRFGWSSSKWGVSRAQSKSISRASATSF